MYYVYVIKSKQSNMLYKGFTSDLKRRIHEHNTNKVFSTKHDIPWVLIYYEAFVSKVDARREELFLKSGKGRERLKFLLKNTNK